MATERVMHSIERVIDDLYRDSDEVSRDEIYDRVERGEVAPEVATYFRHLPDGDYTLDELVDEIGVQVYQAGDTDAGARGTRG
jgi:hypothetical protein